MATPEDIKGQALGLFDQTYDLGVADGKASRDQEVADLQARIAELEQPPTPPTPARPRKVGEYKSGNNPTPGLGLASGYIRFDQTIPDRLVACLNGGASLIVAVDTKSAGPVWHPLTEFARGQYDANLTRLRDDALRRLDAAPDGTEVFLGFMHEAAIRHADGKNPNKAPGDTAATYVDAANHVAELWGKGGDERLIPIHWQAQANAAAVPFLPERSLFGAMSADLYKTGSHPVAETAEQTWAPLRSFADAHGWGDARLFITESGIKTDVFSDGGRFDTATQVAFYQGWPAAMEALNIEGAIFFDADGTNHDYRPTDPAVTAAFATMVAEVQE